MVRNFFQTKSMEGERDGLGENSIAAEMNTTIFVGWINYRAGQGNHDRAKSKSIPASRGLNERGLNCDLSFTPGV
jgi:hypothetical protein